MQSFFFIIKFKEKEKRGRQINDYVDQMKLMLSYYGNRKQRKSANLVLYRKIGMCIKIRALLVMWNVFWCVVWLNNLKTIETKQKKYFFIHFRLKNHNCVRFTFASCGIDKDDHCVPIWIHNSDRHALHVFLRGIRMWIGALFKM